MRALVLTLLLVLGSSSAANGQALLVLLFGDKLSTESFQLGIGAAANWSTMSGLTDGSSRFSWSFGADAEIKLSEKWHLQPELIFKTPAGAKGLVAGEAGNPFQATGDSLVDEAIATGSVTRSMNYVSLPVVAKYLIGPFAIGAGGYVAYLTGATDVLESDVLQGTLELKQGVKGVLNKLDAGLVGSLYYAIKPEHRMRSIKVVAKLYWGLTNTVQDNPGSAVQNRIVFVGLSIPIGGKHDAPEKKMHESGSR